jgi:hypothetical protein
MTLRPAKQKEGRPQAKLNVKNKQRTAGQPHGGPSEAGKDLWQVMQYTKSKSESQAMTEN